jgi:uncharacterized protein (DUF1501 family)
MNRRHFLKSSALASSFFMVPKVLKPLENINIQNQDKILVVIQLSGGNDSLNTFIPYTNDFYYKARPSIGLKNTDIIKLNESQAMTASMQSLEKWFDNGNAAILNSVGYPDMDHSHFRSMEIWQTASNTNEYLDSGWLGRWMDDEKNSYSAIEIDDSLSLALKGKNKTAMAFTDIKKINEVLKQENFKNVNAHAIEHEESLTNYLYQTLQEVKSGTRYIHEKNKIYTNDYTYPNTSFAKQLKTIADLILSGVDTKVFYVSLSGFDTHTNEVQRHNRLMKQYAEATNAFLENLKQKNKLENTLIMTFSEFGRRVEENAAYGTDHGTAGNVWLLGGKLKKAGVLNALPDLQNLNAGDLVYKEDFRNIYTTILDNWLGANSKSILGSQYKNLGFV